MLRHAASAGIGHEELTRRLAARLRAQAFDTDDLFEMAVQFDGAREVEAVRAAVLETQR
jgi:hypothetical protein